MSRRPSEPPLRRRLVFSADRRGTRDAGGRGATVEQVSEASVTCDLCGAVVPGPTRPPLTWSLSLERGQVQRYCDVCTRDNLRAMEGKLDQEYW